MDTRAATSPASSHAAATSLSRRRRVAVWTVLVLASLVTLVSTLTTWVNRQMLDNHAWRTATEQVVRDPAVQSALSTYLVAQLYDNVNVGAALEQRLPNQIKPLAGPVAGALQPAATQAVGAILARPRVQQLWIEASTLAHEKLVNVLENKTGYGISTGSGVVTLNLRALVVELGTSLGLPADALAKLPATAGTVTLMRSDQLAAAQTAVRSVKVLSAWLLVLALGLYALAIWLARGERRRTLRNAGWALVLVGLVELVIRRLVGNWLVDSLASPGYETSTHHLWLIGTSILGQIAAATILYGAITTAGALLAGPTVVATSVRRRIAPVLNERPGVAWGVVGGAYLLLVLWGGTHALRTWWGILLLAGLAAAGVLALRRQTLQEFPAGAVEPAAPAPVPVPGPAVADRARRSPAEEIALLRELREAGAITDEEFEQGKRSALS